MACLLERGPLRPRGAAPYVTGAGREGPGRRGGCSTCIEGGIKHVHKSGEHLDDRLLAVAAWGHSPLFSAEERAALALTEAMTRLADQPDAVPDEIWNAAAEHFDDRALAALVLHIALTNLLNRLNVTTRQPAGDW